MLVLVCAPMAASGVVGLDAWPRLRPSVPSGANSEHRGGIHCRIATDGLHPGVGGAGATVPSEKMIKKLHAACFGADCCSPWFRFQAVGLHLETMGEGGS